MSDHDATTDEGWRDLLSALLDGELNPEDEQRVSDLVADSPGAQEELAALTRVRTLVRDLPPVDPPFGFYERMLRPAGRPRRVGMKVGGAFAAAAAAIVLVVGITPATDPIVPPVEAYAARHVAMEPIVASAPAGPAPTTLASNSAPTSTSRPTSTSGPTPPGSDFAELPAAELDAIGTRSELNGDFRRMQGYQNPDGVVHLLYSDGRMLVSVYEQTGDLAWERLPEGTTLDVNGTRTWTMATATGEVMVFERGTMVYTVVAQPMPGAHDEMVELSVDLPEGADPSMFDRFRTGCRSMAARFSMGTSEP